ncbi:MAG: hypothetical protein VB948_03085 [Pseudomonadales bacterium]|jgi:hypothetical protein
MPVLKHPLTGAIYTATDDGLVEVDSNGLKGLFYCDGRHHSGDLRYADPHMLMWLAGPSLPEGAAVRINRPAPISSNQQEG